MNNIRLLVTSIIIFSSIGSFASGLSFHGNAHSIITETPNASTGLEAIYVLAQTSGVSATYTSSSSNVKWYRWSSQGAAYAQEIPQSDISRNGNKHTLQNVPGDCGITIEDGNNTHYFWITDYSRHMYDISSIEAGEDSDCSMASLSITGNADRITYYSINARAYELDREIHISYNTLIADAENLTYTQSQADESTAYINAVTRVPAPLCDTYFTVSGDKYLSAWGLEKSCTSPYYHTSAVEATVNVSRANDETAENEQTTELGSASLGGSAPVEINMVAAVSDAAIFREWQITNDAQFNDVTLRANELEYTHTFSNMGTYYIRFVCADASGECQWTSDTYTVFIGESRLLCPNAFSPDASPGVNDEWKVSYRSLISFECHIFNKWGVKMTEFTDPAQGWDGKYGGKYVPAGVYYYVIKAEGADGVKYDLSGDINIVKYQ